MCYRHVVCSVAIALLVVAPYSQADIVGKTVDYQVAGATYEGYLAQNTALGDDQPVVLIIHDWAGLGDYEKRRAQMLAEQGYAAFAADLYGKGVRPQALADKKARTSELYGDREAMRERLFGAMEQLGQLDGLDPDSVVAIGYCFGGAAVLELARAGADAEGFVIFHGGLATPEGQDYSQVKAPIVVLHGSSDSSVPMSEVAALANALDGAGVEHTMEIYGGAPHAFTFWDDRERYVPSADFASWEALMRFLDDRL